MKFGGVVACNSFNGSKKRTNRRLIGPNGAGKTTIFNVVTGVYKPAEGRVVFSPRDYEKHELVGLSPDKIAKLGVCRTFQNIRLFNHLSVLENVFIGSHLRIKSDVFSTVLRLPHYVAEERENYEKSMYLLGKIGLQDAKDEKAYSLPYGMQRRLEMARALATDPKLLLLDEPAAGMNPQETRELIKFIREIKEEFDLTIFLIEHHMDVIMEIRKNLRFRSWGINCQGNQGSSEERKGCRSLFGVG